MYDLAIIGGGPAGAAAGVYAARKLLKTVLIAEEFGGQSVVSEEVQNWIGTEKISGSELAKNLEAHVRAYAGSVVDIAKGERVTLVEKTENGFSITTKSGKTYEAKTLLVGSGGTRRKLDVPGAATFDHKGLTYCASCDGPLFSDMDVAVVGGGNAGFESAAQLLAYTKSVTLLHRSGEFTADPSTIEKVLADQKMRAVKNVEILEVIGEKFVTGIKYRIKGTDTVETLAVSGIFVEIGMVPATDYVEKLVKTDAYKRIITDPTNQRTSVPGIWAAGDCTDAKYHQNNIAAGQAVTAIEDIYMTLKAT